MGSLTRNRLKLSQFSKGGRGNKFVGDIRRSLPIKGSDEPRTYTTPHGTVATMNTGNIGRIEEALAGRRQEREPGGKFLPTGEDKPKGKSADLAASAVGWSGETYRQAKKVALTL